MIVKELKELLETLTDEELAGIVLWVNGKEAVVGFAVDDHGIYLTTEEEGE